VAVIAFHRYCHPTVLGLSVLLDASKKVLKTFGPVIDLELFKHLAAG
jgi:hypothetical protein